MTKLIVFLPNWVGDLVMATPALRALRRHFGPAAELVGVMRPHLAELLQGTNWLSAAWPFDPRSKDPSLRRWALLRRMRRARFDVALLMPNSLHAALLAWLGGARQRVGYARDGRSLLLTRTLCPPTAGGRRVECPMVDYYLMLATAVGCEPESPRLELATRESDEKSAEQVFARLGLPGDGRVVGLNTGSANGAARCWPAERLAALARRVVERLEHHVLVFCGPKERELARSIAAQAGSDRVACMADQPLDFGTAKACLRRIGLLVTSDSGPRHIAAAMGTPVMTLYGPTTPLASENPTVRAINVQLDLPCIGCWKPICPLGHNRCMTDLTVDTVYAEVARAIGAGATAASDGPYARRDGPHSRGQSSADQSAVKRKPEQRR